MIAFCDLAKQRDVPEKEEYMDTQDMARRPIKSRNSGWAAAIARWLKERGVRPNQISVASVLFAGLAAAALIFASRVSLVPSVVLYVVAAGCIQARLLCNLFDGMVAVEGGLRTKSGGVFNDLPDRLADPLVLVAAGYSVAGITWAPHLGWAAALMAVLTAYVRVLGAVLGAGERFTGPMAKQHRMAAMTVACLLASVAVFWGWDGPVIAAALATVAAGCVVTFVRRTAIVVRELESR